MPDTRTIDVPIPVGARLAKGLSDPGMLVRASQAVNEALRKAAVEQLIALMDRIAAEAERRGLTEEILEEELAACNAEHRERRAPPKA